MAIKNIIIIFAQFVFLNFKTSRVFALVKNVKFDFVHIFTLNYWKILSFSECMKITLFFISLFFMLKLSKYQLPLSR